MDEVASVRCRCNLIISPSTAIPVAGTDVIVCPRCGKAYKRIDFKGENKC